MHEILIKFLSSSCCKKDLLLDKKKVIVKSTTSDSFHDVVEGILTCSGCFKTYPIINAIPRLCNDLWNSELEEMKRIRKTEGAVILNENRKDLTNPETYNQIEKIVREKWNIKQDASNYIKKKAENDFRYQIKECERQEKVINTLKLYLNYNNTIKTVLDIGGGTGGLIKCLNDHFKPIFSIMLDYDLSWINVAQLRCPDIQIIRGDAMNLPFKKESIDCVFSLATIEHIQNYERALREMCYVTKHIFFVSWNPNKYFLYDIGHLDAPITIFPRKIAYYVAIFWHKIRKTGRTKEHIAWELERTFYISTTHVKKVLSKHGKVFNVFKDFCLFSLKSDYSYRMGKLKKFLISHTFFTRIILRSLVFLKIEPFCYYIMKKNLE